MLIVAAIVQPRETDLLSPGFSERSSSPSILAPDSKVASVPPSPSYTASREDRSNRRNTIPPTAPPRSSTTTLANPFLSSVSRSFLSPWINLVPRERNPKRANPRVAVVEQVNRLISLPFPFLPVPREAVSFLEGGTPTTAFSLLAL